MNTLAQVARFIRWRDWGPGKLTLLVSLCLYLAVAYNINFTSFLTTFIAFTVFAFAQCTLGYVLNDWGDQQTDRKQFKPNGFNGKSRLEALLLLMLVVVMAIVAGMPLVVRPGLALLWAAWAVMTAAYSLEPLRLKSRGAVGLLASVAGQWFLPVLIVFAAFQVAGGWDMWLLAGAVAVMGAVYDFGHQRCDRERDLVTRSNTLAVGMQPSRLDRLYELALLVDKLAIGVASFVVARAVQQIGFWWGPWLAGIIAATYLFLLLATLPGALRAVQEGFVEDPHYAPRSDFPTLANILHQTLLNLIVPVVLGIAVTLRIPVYGITLGLFLILRLVLGEADWSWPWRALRMAFVKS